MAYASIGLHVSCRAGLGSALCVIMLETLEILNDGTSPWPARMACTLWSCLQSAKLLNKYPLSPAIAIAIATRLPIPTVQEQCSDMPLRSQSVSISSGPSRILYLSVSRRGSYRPTAPLQPLTGVMGNAPRVSCKTRHGKPSVSWVCVCTCNATPRNGSGPSISVSLSHLHFSASSSGRAAHFVVLRGGSWSQRRRWVCIRCNTISCLVLAVCGASTHFAQIANGRMIPHSGRIRRA